MPEKPQRVIEDILRRPDPTGYYVIVLRRDDGRANIVDAILEKYRGKVVEETLGDIIVIRTKSRRIARDIARLALELGVLETK
ncbi:MAG TPA: hypothetical protein EYH50_00995 [Pyrodictium delaneyi]|uniref:Uncharacterized protein n=1 Tax=Pyrodictium delaneyi TaxID=1273541 RepID=A0A833E8X3_9CREN|nr:hypothetical protein [Pyrodictium delaneyi]